MRWCCDLDTVRSSCSSSRTVRSYGNDGDIRITAAAYDDDSSLPRDGGRGTSDDAKSETTDPTKWMFGGNAVFETPKVGEETAMVRGSGINISIPSSSSGPSFQHADLGTDCGSVLLMLAWAFGEDINSVGIDTQTLSSQCVRRASKRRIR